MIHYRYGMKPSAPTTRASLGHSLFPKGPFQLPITSVTKSHSEWLLHAEEQSSVVKLY
jgi:hypothetical protein